MKGYNFFHFTGDWLICAILKVAFPNPRRYIYFNKFSEYFGLKKEIFYQSCTGQFFYRFSNRALYNFYLEVVVDSGFIIVLVRPKINYLYFRNRTHLWKKYFIWTLVLLYWTNNGCSRFWDLQIDRFCYIKIF